MLGNLWMPGIALIAGTLPLPQAGKAQRPSPPAVFPTAEKVPGQLGILCQGTGMWGMQGRGQGRGGDASVPPGGRRKPTLVRSQLGRHPLPLSPQGLDQRTGGNWAVCLLSSAGARNRRSKGFFKITASVVWSRWLPGTPLCQSHPTPACS